MRKLRVYLDTSVISHLDQQDNPEYMQITLEFWKEAKKGKYNIYISDAVVTELDECPEPKRTKLIEYLNEIKYEKINIDKQIIELAGKYINASIIPAKFSDAAIHIAAATLSECDVLVSWNYKNIVKAKTMFGVNGVNKILRYKEIQLVSPVMMIDEMFETSAMAELHRIREQIYEETKNMTDEEFIQYIRNKVNKAEEEMKRLKEKNKKETVK